MQSYKDLEIYQLAHRLAIEIHSVSLTLPRFELYEEGSQIRRASKAISANLVEGYTRRKYKADYLRFLTYVHAECNETIEHLELLVATASLSAEQGVPLRDDYTILSRKINRFIQAVNRQHLT
jgi:four helix bundle protein